MRRDWDDIPTSLILPKQHRVPAILFSKQTRAAARKFAYWLKARPMFRYETRRRN